MNQASIDALQLVREMARRLAKEEYVQWSQTHRGPALQISWDSLTIQHTRPSDTQRRSLILTLRMFIQQRDHCSFHWLDRNVFRDPAISDEWTQQFNRVYDDVKQWWSHPSGLVAPDTYILYELTMRDIQDIFVYGDAAHANPDKKRTFGRWRANKPWFAHAEFEFDRLLMGLLPAIWHLARMCEEELGQGSN